MRYTRATRRGSAGFTLVEMAVAAVVAAMAIGAFGMVAARSRDAANEGRMQDHLNARAFRALERVLTELEGAEAATINPPPLAPLGGLTIDYRHGDGAPGGVPQFTPFRRLEVVLATGELANGLDDDGDGLVDERRLELVEDPGGPDERRTVWAYDVAGLLEGEVANLADDNGNGLVDEPGCVFEQQGNVMVVRLTLQATADGGRVLLRTVQSAVRLRN